MYFFTSETLNSMRVSMVNNRKKWMLLIVLCAQFLPAGADTRIRPQPDNPFYWQVFGEPRVLIGGSVDDNLFQLPDLEQHLDAIAAAGGNYIRNTMSERPDKGFEIYPYNRLDNGQYDLTKWNEAYWLRFDNLIKWTAERHIVVQIELWDRFDYTDKISRLSHGWLDKMLKLFWQPRGWWELSPYNPGNNVNYTFDESRLAGSYIKHPNRNEQPFFRTVPELDNNSILLKHQIARVDKILSYTLQYGHVLYCIDNETSGDPAWSAFWAEYIRQRAKTAGVEVQITEMWDDWEVLSDQHKTTYDQPDLYSFVDISQNNTQKGEAHWKGLMSVRDYLSDNPRPMNNVKIYGSKTSRYGTRQDAIERFWRNILGGAATARFHRPDSGLGLSDISKTQLKSMKLYLAAVDQLHMQPDKQYERLSERHENEAYLAYEQGRQYAVYFPQGGEVALDTGREDIGYRLLWLDIGSSEWSDEGLLEAGRNIQLETPGSGHWLALLRAHNIE
jgi:hypothetical protein